jgi:uncharacterized protein
VEAIRFADVPFALEWLIAPAEWHAAPSRLVARAPARTDWFVDPIGGLAVSTAPVLLGPPPPGDFTLAAQVAVEGESMFDAAGLFVHADDGNWAKLAVEVTGAGPTIVSVVTATFSDDCNSTVLAGPSAWLRLARVGQALAFHASADGARWELVRVFRAPGAAPRIGFVCQAPTGEGCTGSFESIGFAARSLADVRDGS